jgi:hypothetical protein
VIGKSGTAILKTDKSTIKEVEIEKFLSSYLNAEGHDETEEKKLFLNSERNPVNFNQLNEPNPKSIKTLKGRLEAQAELNTSVREGEPGQYPIGDKMKNRDKVNLSCFMMGGF